MSPHARAENDRSRERLKNLGASLGPAGWRKKLPNGRTTATAFLHLAFWDRLALETIGTRSYARSAGPESLQAA